MPDLETIKLRCFFLSFILLVSRLSKNISFFFILCFRKLYIALKKNNYSTALMIDQRVSEGVLCNLFNQDALTTTIPAQLVRKFNIPVVPVYIERIKDLNFKISINNPINFSKEDTVENITLKLNQILETIL